MSSKHLSCPHCFKDVVIDSLRKIPQRLASKWYQFTAAPQLACPHCGRVVSSSVANSRWWWLVIVPFSVGLLPWFVPSFSYLLHDWRFILLAEVLPALGAFLILKTNRLVPHPPEHET